MIRAGDGATGLGLVALHGRGGSAADMVGLARALGLGGAAIAAPEAPGRSWWPTSFLAPAAQMGPWVDQGLGAVDAAIAALAADGIPRDRTVVMGFSQGACLALEHAARRGSGLRAVLAFSGGLVGTGDAGGEPRPELHGHAPKRFDYATDLAGTDVMLNVHARDPHIPLARVEETARVLRGLGAAVCHTVVPGAGHAVTADAAQRASRLLAA
jgi:predicted esterase